MPNPAREAWRRLPWRRWLARGALLGLCAATTFGIAIFVAGRDAIVAKHPELAPSWWLYMGLGVAMLLALLALLSRQRHALVAVIALSALTFAFESAVLGWGPHLVRIPVSLLLAIWVDRGLRV